MICPLSWKLFKLYLPLISFFSFLQQISPPPSSPGGSSGGCRHSALQGLGGVDCAAACLTETRLMGGERQVCDMNSERDCIGAYKVEAQVYDIYRAREEKVFLLS